MKKITLLTNALIFSILFSFGQNQYKTDIVKIATIDFPSKPNVIDTLGRKIYSYANENASFLVIVSNYKENDIYELKDGDLSRFYDGVVEGMLKTTKGKLINKKTINIDGLNGIEIEFSSITNPILQDLRFTQILYSDKGVFIINYWANSEKRILTPDERNKFFNSFQFTINKESLKQYTIAKSDQAYNISFIIGEIIGYIIMLAILVGLITFTMKKVRGNKV